MEKFLGLMYKGTLFAGTVIIILGSVSNGEYQFLAIAPVIFLLYSIDSRIEQRITNIENTRKKINKNIKKEYKEQQENELIQERIRLNAENMFNSIDGRRVI